MENKVWGCWFCDDGAMSEEFTYCPDCGAELKYIKDNTTQSEDSGKFKGEGK